MSRRFACILSSFVIAVVFSAAPLHAENEGQDDLDQATQKKLSATNPDDLSQVIELSESAIKKGLDPANTQIAQNLLISTLLQRANFITKVIVERQPPGWPKLRQMALDDLEKALKTRAELPTAELMVARLQTLPGGDRAAALKAAEKAAATAKDDPAIQVEALTLEAKLESDPAKIEERLNAALKIAPRNDEVLVYRGRLYLEQGKPEEAQTDLSAAVKANPENAEAQEALGQALFALKHNDEALKAFDESIKLSPDAAGPLVHRARVRLEQHELPDALSDVAEALKLESKNAAALMLRARIHHEQGDTKAADADIAELLKEGDSLPPAMRLLISAGSGGVRQTTADMEELAKVFPKNPQLLTELAALYTLRKQPHKSIEKYTQAIEADPKLVLALRGRADAYLSVGKHADAIADYNEAIKLKPHDPSVLNNLAWVLATSPDESLRDGKRSIELATEAADLTDHKQSHILSTLAAGYAETGDFDKASEWSKKAVAIGSEDSETSEQLKQELASYKEKKPWREKQDLSDREDTPKSADNSSSAKK